MFSFFFYKEKSVDILLSTLKSIEPFIFNIFYLLLSTLFDIELPFYEEVMKTYKELEYCDFWIKEFIEVLCQ